MEYDTRGEILILDSKLNFVPHITELRNKISKAASMIHQASKYAPTFILKQMYYAYAYPHFHYAANIWGNTSPTHLQPLFLIQKRLIRTITQSDFLAHTKPLFAQTKILNVYDIIKLQNASFMFINQQKFNTATHQYETRNRHNLIPDHPYLNVLLFPCFTAL